MDCRIELIFVPVTDVDRAIEFSVDKVGFTLDMQARVDENTRFVQVTPPTSACSIAFGEGLTDMTPGNRPATICSPGFMSGCSNTVGPEFKVQL